MKHKDIISEYCKLLDKTHGQRGDLLWFSTWMSSKSPYHPFPRGCTNYLRGEKLPFSGLLEKKILNFLLTHKTMLFFALRVIFCKLKYYHRIKDLKKQKDIIFARTFLYSEEKDPFFANLFKSFSKEKNFLILYDDNKNFTSPNRLNTEKIYYLPIISFVDFYALITSYFYIIREYFFSSIYIENDLDLTDFATRCYQYELLTPSSYYNLISFFSFKNVLNNFDITRAILPFENNPWEKMFHLANQKSQKNIYVIGYMHSSIQKDATNYRLSDYEIKHNLIPKKILTTGKTPKRILEEMYNSPEILIDSSCALRYEYLREISPVKFTENLPMNVVVILDGTDSAIDGIKLIHDFVKAKSNDHVKFIIRAHPNYPISHQLKQKYQVEACFNNESLENTLSKANAIIYTGSTVAIEACKFGVPLIHFNIGNFNFDPLYFLEDYKWNIHNTEQLSHSLSQISLLKMEDIQQLLYAYEKCINEYFSNCSEENLKKFFN